MARDAEPTRAALIAAAERLLAAQGVDRASLREINRASGARNAVALQYHFTDRQGLVRAVLRKHYPAVDRRRRAMLDRYERAGRADLRALGEALVVPSAAKLADPDGGPAYLQITAELLGRHTAALRRDLMAAPDTTFERWRALVAPFLPQEGALLHRRFTAVRFAAVELGRWAASGPHRDDRLFVSELVDLVTALLAAPVSAATASLATERRRRAPAHPGG